MLKDQKGSHLVAAMLLVLVVGVIGFVGYKVIGGNRNTPSTDKRGPNYQALQACNNKPVLTTLPMDPAKMEGIAPLGGVDPPGHTLPTDHMYMMYPYGETTQKEIYAPADIVITTVSYGDVYENGVQKTSDYRVDFYACRELKVIFGHVDTPSDKITSVIGTPQQASAETCKTTKQLNEEIRSCNWDTDITLSAGELFGTSNGWDLWATYEGMKGQVITPGYYHNVDAVCPLDYWTEPIKTQLYTLVKGNQEPRCGKAYIDIAGALQGGWFAQKDPQQARSDWGSHLSLSHHSVTGIGQLAVAGTIANQFMYNFTPKHMGTINIEPGETKVGILYCYQHEGDQRFPNGRMAGSGKVLLKMSDAHTMQVEKQEASCSESESFSSPTTYYR